MNGYKECPAVFQPYGLAYAGTGGHRTGSCIVRLGGGKNLFGKGANPPNDIPLEGGGFGDEPVQTYSYFITIDKFPLFLKLIYVRQEILNRKNHSL